MRKTVFIILFACLGLSGEANVVRHSYDLTATVSYTYYSLGKPKTVTTGGVALSMDYYDTGTQKTLKDPNAGTTTYEYDAAARLIKQTDGRGKITSRIYDQLGRDSIATVDGVAFNYFYGAADNARYRLTKQQTGNNSIAFTYDNLGRIQKESRQIDGSGTLDFSYAYNSLGQLDNTTYPNNLQVSNVYDVFGNLQTLKAGSQILWELTGATGTVTTEQAGGVVNYTTTLDSKGLLSNLKAATGATLYNTSYSFDGATGNLNSRTNMSETAQTYLYDNLDRLTTVQQNSSTLMSIAYLPNGNIDSKTGLGTYSYSDPLHVHAVTSVQNTGNMVSTGAQTIDYNGFNKVFKISETVGTDNYALDLMYGPDQQRWKTTLKKNNVDTKTIIFAGDYEKVTANGITQELYYIGDKVIYVKQAGQPDKIYCLIKDHLGSIVKIVDNTGATVFAANYDVWGNRTVTNNTFAFHRGFTGHEHLPEFNLINMNGRMYDPILGRFLSPDPFVQSPFDTQNFNRYSYCFNNPLKFTDPNGEFAWIPFIAFVVFNALEQGAMADMNGGNFWNGAWKGALVGAATYGLGSIAPLGTTWVGSTVWNAAVGTAASAGNVWASGSNDYSKIWIGTVTGGISGFISSQEFGNWIRGQGFNSNQKVYENIMFSAYGNPDFDWRQAELDYFGFEGKYDPEAKDPGNFNKDTKAITYGPSAFGGRGNSYSQLRAVYEEEIFHRSDYLIYKSKMPAGITDEHAYEEYRAQVHLYKNQGLYHESKFDWGNRINVWGSKANVNSDIIFKYNFERPWWHFIYKIPRRW